MLQPIDDWRCCPPTFSSLGSWYWHCQNTGSGLVNNHLDLSTTRILSTRYLLDVDIIGLHEWRLNSDVKIFQSNHAESAWHSFIHCRHLYSASSVGLRSAQHCVNFTKSLMGTREAILYLPLFLLTSLFQSIILILGCGSLQESKISTPATRRVQQCIVRCINASWSKQGRNKTR